MKSSSNWYQNDSEGATWIWRPIYWVEHEDLIDDWLGITTLDADKHGPSLKNALVGAASFYKSMLDMPYSEIRLVASPFLRTHWDHTSKSCVSLAIPPVVSHIPRPEWIRALDRAFRDCTEETPCIVGRPDWWFDRFTGCRHDRIFGSTHWWTASALPAITKWWRKNIVSRHPSGTNDNESHNINKHSHCETIWCHWFS